MLNRDALVKRLIEKYESGKPSPAALQEERRRLHALQLDKLGDEFKKVFKTEDPYLLKSAP
jgi:hypothetical protein